MKHEIQLIITKDNVLLVDKEAKIQYGDWRVMISNKGGIAYSRNEPPALQSEGWVLYKLIASEKRIDPSIPLFRQEDIKRERRYSVLEMKDQAELVTWFIDDSKDYTFKYKNDFTELKYAQDYCNYLNSKQDSVDVEALAEQMIKEDTHGLSKSLIFQLKRYFIEGYNECLKTSPKGGWSDEDLEEIIGMCIDKQANGKHIFLSKIIEDFKEKRKQQPTTITLEWEGDKSEVDKDGYIIVNKTN